MGALSTGRRRKPETAPPAFREFENGAVKPRVGRQTSASATRTAFFFTPDTRTLSAVSGVNSLDVPSGDRLKDWALGTAARSRLMHPRQQTQAPTQAVCNGNGHLLRCPVRQLCQGHLNSAIGSSLDLVQDCLSASQRDAGTRSRL